MIYCVYKIAIFLKIIIKSVLENEKVVIPNWHIRHCLQPNVWAKCYFRRLCF